jgi:hypothetical protein
VWAFERNVGFTNKLLLSYFMEKCSNKELMYVMIHSSFFCERLGPYLQRMNNILETQF